jgi:hypothetical protein
MLVDVMSISNDTMGPRSDSFFFISTNHDAFVLMASDREADRAMGIQPC